MTFRIKNQNYENDIVKSRCLTELEYLKKTGTFDTVMDRMKSSTEADFIDL